MVQERVARTTSALEKEGWMRTTSALKNSQVPRTILKASGFYFWSFWVLFLKLLGSIFQAPGFYFWSFWVLFFDGPCGPGVGPSGPQFFFNTLRLFYSKGFWRYSKSSWVLFVKLLGSIFQASGLYFWSFWVLFLKLLDSILRRALRARCGPFGPTVFF